MDSFLPIYVILRFLEVKSGLLADKYIIAWRKNLVRKGFLICVKKKRMQFT